jgi:RNA polymerase sigma factor (sigma-70 family)
VPNDHPSDHHDPERLRTLLLAAARKDATAFRALYDATAPKLFGFALRILHKHELAEEALQDGFVAIWHAAATYQGALASPMTWMATIVRNKALDIHRRRDPAGVEIDAADFSRDVVEAMEAPGRGPADALQWQSEAQALAHCMARLERPHQQAIGLAFYHDLSHSEVAQQLSLPVGTVKTWIRRGLEKLKSCLGREHAA